MRLFNTLDDMLPIRREGPVKLQPVRRDSDPMLLAKVVCTAVAEATHRHKFTWRGIFSRLRPAV